MKIPEQVVTEWVEAFNRRDAAAAAALYHRRRDELQLALDEPTWGRQAICEDFAAFFRAFPDSYTHVDQIFEDGEWAIIEWTGGGTLRGEFAGHAPNGRSFTLKGCGFFYVVDGLIRFQRGYWDKTAWFSQLDIPLRITSPRGRDRQFCTAMNAQSRRFAGILLVVLPTVMIGGVSLLSLLLWEPAYAANPLRQDLWRAGHAHAGVLLVLSLIVLRYVDEARLSEAARWFVRLSVPGAAILLPAAFFLSVLSPTAQQPNVIIYLAFVGAALLAAGVLTLGVGLIRGGNQHEQK